MLAHYTLYSQPLASLQDRKLLITTINAHSYNVSREDREFEEALMKSDVLIPDGVSVVKAIRWITGQKLVKIAGADLFFYEMERMQRCGGSVFFLGSANATLDKIVQRANTDYPAVRVGTYSPPYKPDFTAEDNAAMIEAVNTFAPQVLMVGMTAPKQEKWAYLHKDELNTGHICCIGAVFDFYAGTVQRAPRWMISLGLEWLYRFIKEPRRLWRRYLIGNTKFILAVIAEKLGSKR